jgi:LPXTG-motif cell wall-anchored protein
MGTVSYAVYSNNTCTTLVQALGTKVVNNGLVGPSDLWTPAAAGNFWFQATYSGDGANLGPIKSGCETEPITVGSPPVTEGTTATSLAPQTTVAQAELPRTGGPQGFTALIALSLLLVGAGLWLFGSRIRSAARR